MRFRNPLLMTGVLTAALAIGGCSSQTSQPARDLSGTDNSSPSASPSGSPSATPAPSAPTDTSQGRDCGDIQIKPGANLRGCDFHDANFSGQHLTGADLTGANLTNAHLNNTIMSGANLTSTTMTGADLSHAEMTGTRLDRVTSGQIIGTPAKLASVWRLKAVTFLVPTRIWRVWT